MKGYGTEHKLSSSVRYESEELSMRMYFYFILSSGAAVHLNDDFS
jgi:hypothetical protein